MSSRDWGRARDRSRIARQGAESIDGAGVQHGPPAARTPKETLRADLAAASKGATVEKLVVCPCGHRGKVRVPIERLGSVRFRCGCGRLQT